ncbi:MAG: hypothetical protein ACRDQF_13150 [Thermocrispum sp.]
MTSTVTFEDITAKQQQTWSSGDYGKVVWVTVPVAETLAEAAELRPGARVLDVATGTATSHWRRPADSATSAASTTCPRWLRPHSVARRRRMCGCRKGVRFRVPLTRRC